MEMTVVIVSVIVGFAIYFNRSKMVKMTFD